MSAAERRLRVGVAGVGSLGFHHARILSGLPGVALSGVYDVRPERAHEVAVRVGATVLPTLDGLLDSADAVVVAVPTSSHEEVAAAALSRGRSVLVEKPIAPTLQSADRILAAAEAAGSLIQIGHVERFNPAVIAAAPFLDTPLFVESHRLAPFSPRSTDVAVALDLMIHDVDLVQSLVGAPVREIAAVGVPVLTARADIANARLVFESGAVANLTASRISVEPMRKLRVFHRSGYLSLDLAAGHGEFLRLRRGLPALADECAEAWPDGAPDLARIVERIPIRGDGVEPLRRELENFRDAVLGRASPAVSGQQGRAALQLILAIEERIQERAPAAGGAPRHGSRWPPGA